MKKIIITLASFILSTAFIHAQEVTGTSATPLIPVVKLGDNVQVKFGGFVRAEYYVDSREAVGGQDGLFGFFPKAESDNSGDQKDKYAVARQNFSAQATRFNALFTGPDAFKAKSSAFFEFDFTGSPTTTNSTTANQSASTAIGLRLRHAYTKLNWTKAELLLGKTWNPLADITQPSVIGLNTGIPFRPFGRGDQFRLTLKPTGSINILLAALYQSENKSTIYNDATGTAVAGTNDIRSNPVPDFHLQLHFRTSSFWAGLVSEYKVIRPATQTTGTGGVFNTSSTIGSYAFGAFVDYKKNKFNAKAGGLYGQNLSELYQQGGYAVKSFNATTGAKTYTPSNALSYWANITYGNKLVAGVFGGYQKNLGFSDNILTSAQAGNQAVFLGNWQNIDHIYRVGPSLKYSIGRLVFAAEVEYNVAAYGTIDYTNKGKVKDTKETSGVRGTFATTFLF